MKEINKIGERKSRTRERARERERLRGKRWERKRSWVEGRHRCKHQTPNVCTWWVFLGKKFWGGHGTAHFFANGETEFQREEDLAEGICRDNTVHRHEAWICAGNVTVVIWVHPHTSPVMLTLIKPLQRPVTCPGSASCSWKRQVWAQTAVSHTLSLHS